MKPEIVLHKRFPEETPETEEISIYVKEVLARVPKWYERWGISLIGLLVVMLLTLAWFIRYPDIVRARAMITTQIPPLTVVSRTTGQLTQLVKENAHVEKNTYLAVIQNPGDATDIQQVKQQLAQVQQNLLNPAYLTHVEPAIVNRLGEVQVDFSSFVQSLRNYQRLLNLPYYRQRVQNIERQIRFLSDLNGKLLRQLHLMEEGFQLSSGQYHRDSLLLADRVIAQADFEKSQIAWLEKKNLLENIRISADNNKLQQAQLLESLIIGDEQYVGSQQNAYTILGEEIRKLSSKIEAWEQTYLLKAPAAGQVAYLRNWTENQFVNSNEAVFSIVPAAGALIGKIDLPLQGSGKVQVGQRVILKLDNYPYYQYGALTGRVESISLVPNGENYQLTVSLPQGLHTNFNRSLVFKQQMRGTAEIITDDLNLLERIFLNFRSLLKDHTRP